MAATLTAVAAAGQMRWPPSSPSHSPTIAGRLVQVDISAARRPVCAQATKAPPGGIAQGLGQQPGHQESHHYVGTCETHTLPFVLSLDDALTALKSFVCQLRPPVLGQGILRVQVPLPPNVKALHWLQCQPECSLLLPRMYFSPRSNTPPHAGGSSIQVTVAGVGSAASFRGDEPFSKKHWNSINRFLSEDSPLIRAYGAIRFNPEVEASEEWQAFGTFYFFIPQIELCETGNYSLLAANLSWGDVAYEKAAETLLTALSSVSVQVSASLNKLHLSNVVKTHKPDERCWHAKVNTVLRELETKSETMKKVVMARQTRLEIDGEVPPLTLLASLQDQNPSAYQFCLQLPDGSAFIGNTPEQLFARHGLSVTSEAVAATRPRGETSVEDNQIGLELLQSCKDHIEFQIVQEAVQSAMLSVCNDVKLAFVKGIIKQPRIQHLCTRFLGVLNNKRDEYDLLAALHPTPAVCGHPSGAAKDVIACTEKFDRGMYAGPVGWFGGQGAEFAVGIRSALVRKLKGKAGCGMNAAYNDSERKDMFLYAGVGIVEGSNSSSEWHELELKTSQFEALLQPSKQLKDAANINMVWARLLVDECCRLGVTYFCVAPGSRSSPLAEAAAANPRVTCISCVDERSLGFYALGYGRGARRPAAVVITSGTAMSNLLPAVVEASQDCVPLLILSADRPHELRDVGANQSINQVKHFGSFVRFDFDLPPATDEVPARMVLTTLDTAIFRATTDPYGPVHVNCPFREPLEAVRTEWDLECLEGLSQWMASASPFTTYIPSSTSSLLDGTATLYTSSQMKEVSSLIASASRGVIVAGGLNQSQTTWAVFKLAKHLRWPLVPDVLSGLRLASKEEDMDVKIIHNLDHVLLNPSLHPSVAPDIILQIGSRITSKRLSQFLQECSPRAYILVEEHPYRHDPGHRLTHRIKSSAGEFARFVMKELTEPEFPERCHSYGMWLHVLSDTVRREILFQLQAEATLTEPCIARIVSSSITTESAVFLGNSMPIRDVDMYADGLTDQQSLLGDQNLPAMVSIGANRGASGIDGVISTAVGFAAGSNKRVTLLIGDLSFLHDTNGLMFLTGREAQPPVTLVVVNNRGGGIFSLLPAAGLMPAVTFRNLISSEHDVHLDKLCHAHRINHILVQSKAELVRALQDSRTSTSSWVIEVASNIQKNANFHRFLQQAIHCHLDRVLPVLSRHVSADKKIIVAVETSPYSFPLTSRLTTGAAEFYRQGFLLRLVLNNGFSGYGEVAPLPGVHEEDLLDVEMQLSILCGKLTGVELPENVALLDGSFSQWLRTNLGPQAETIFPSVRCGLEMAALEALAASHNCSLLSVCNGRPSDVSICGLIDMSEGTPDDVASVAEQLVHEGFTTLKMKVARRALPTQDAAVVVAVRQRVGRSIHLRVDANRRWTLSQAVQFAEAVRECDIQYLEEPVNNHASLPAFLKQTQVRVALDETIDLNPSCFEKVLESAPLGNIVAAVIKPGRLGGFENAYMLCRLSLNHNIRPVISACFESSLSLAAYAQFAAFVDGQSPLPSVAHGLGTYAWIERDAVGRSFSSIVNKGIVSAGAVNAVASTLLQFNPPKPRARSFTSTVALGGYCFTFRVVEVASMLQEKQTVVFLHGFLGSAEDWLPVMHSLASSFRCLAVDLPGHGRASSVTGNLEAEWGLDVLSAALSELLEQLSEGSEIVLAGYSMGARIALYMALHKHQKIRAAVIVSGSPGLRDKQARIIRATQDDSLALSLRLGGLDNFVVNWYKRPLWKSLRRHPDFKNLIASRLAMHKGNEVALAGALSQLSVGRQPCLWEQLHTASIPLLVVVGKADEKFVSIASEMVYAFKTFDKGSALKVVRIDGSGHCVPIESPLLLVQALHSFMLGVGLN
ncbi:protein PHYLLO, chloroplastic [Selaginella moellendorffii]|nr:protein PHYLLO, chloroplastic [Selaginella moellendorffii]|eukprot:XP_002986213.2 protein PHYLLO, chloroplastic [Selaginella moellendorffii]